MGLVFSFIGLGYTLSECHTSLIWLFACSFLCFIVMILIGYYFSNVQAVEAPEPRSYHPEIKNVLTFPPSQHVPANSDFKIYATILDNYGEINNATLTYNNNKGGATQKIIMKLNNGTLSNGTFFGAIPGYSADYYGSNVSYNLTFRDNLNYVSNYSQWFVIHKDNYSPEAFYLGEYEIVRGFKTPIKARASDSESGIKNVTFYYFTNPPSLNSSIRMSLVQGDKWESDVRRYYPESKCGPYKIHFRLFH